MVRKLYMVWGSPPVNAVLITARALNVNLDLHELDFAKQEHLQDWFLQINPSHTVPTLDDGVILWDSHAILMYLAETYGKNSGLYSEKLEEKMKIFQILNLDCGTVFRKMSDCIKPIFYDNKKTLEPKALEAAKETYVVLERILKKNKFLVGDRLTIADISVFSSVAAQHIFLPIDEREFPNLNKWFIHFQSLDMTKAAEKGIEALKIGLQTKCLL
ncbi:hypothetical protein ABEB36_007499 [Hypothenemus hampei]|uniref:Glutathione transferase n=1 Tax=Hypothenemus hampei TaxID=57062 RepID=A0ABD1EUD8_HYPHA